MEVDGMFLYVGFDRKEILMDEGRDFIVGIGFGLQPNARASSRGRAEVEQQRLLVSLCLSECRINVFVPLNSHFNLLRLDQTYKANSYPGCHGRQRAHLAIALVYQPRSCLMPGITRRASNMISAKPRA